MAIANVSTEFKFCLMHMHKWIDSLISGKRDDELETEVTRVANFSFNVFTTLSSTVALSGCTNNTDFSVSNKGDRGYGPH